jgi:acetoin utilization protein AcuB
MIVRDVMTTQLVTVAPDDSLCHASSLLRQHQFHHLPVVRAKYRFETQQGYRVQRATLLFEGVITSQDVELAIEHAHAESSSELLHRPWQERHVAEMMDADPLYVSPTTSVGAAARLLVQRGLSCLPVVEYSGEQQEAQVVLVGLLTRSDLLLALARAQGAFEPGMPLDIQLPDGSTEPLTTALYLAAELHVRVRSIIVAPSADGIPQRATLYLGTIYPMPLLSRLQKAGIQYMYAHPLEAEDPPGVTQVGVPT